MTIFTDAKSRILQTVVLYSTVYDPMRLL